jgi:putative transposase
LSPAKRRREVTYICEELSVSERRACMVVGMPRGSYRYQARETDEERLKAPQCQPKRGRLWLNDGSCVRLRPEYKNHVWSYDFVHDRTRDGRVLRMLTILDEYSRECLSIDVGRKFTHDTVLHRLTDLFFRRGIPKHIRSDNGAEFMAKAVRS